MLDIQDWCGKKCRPAPCRLTDAAVGPGILLLPINL